MKIFIWEKIDNLTENYHDDGGVVIIADSLERAREILNESEARTCEEEPYTRKGKTYTCTTSEYSWCYKHVEPNYIYDVSATEEKLIVFPNAGCC